MSGRLPDASVVVPVNLQDWEDLTFLHWDFPVHLIQRLLPPGLRAQEWGGRAWVGVTPFRMARVRVPGLPTIPGWRAFPELNIRAYVLGPGGRDGIWFLGMTVAKRSFAWSSRTLGLPYLTSDAAALAVDGGVHHRFGAPGLRGSGAEDWFCARTEWGEPLPDEERTPLVDSITGRWTAFHRRTGVLLRTPVQHEPWPLLRATVTGRLTAPIRWVGLPEPDGPPLVHAARLVHSRLGAPRPA